MPNRAASTIPAPDDDLCLAFADTRYWRGTAAPTDELRGPDDLLRWLEKMAHVPTAVTDRFARSPHVLEQALGVRETIYRCFAATASGGAPTETDLTELNAALADAPPRQRIGSNGWVIDTFGTSAATLLAPVLWSAADLLVGKQLARVRQCANPQCGWLFLDNSKSGNRRWCSMSACGNRAKAHRHYLRQKEA
jgi:predicted RNA-binding Zn ribbon-like protein